MVGGTEIGIATFIDLGQSCLAFWPAQIAYETGLAKGEGDCWVEKR